MRTEERELHGWRKWLKGHPVLFGYTYAGLVYGAVAAECVKRYWPVAVALAAIFGLGVVVGSL